MKKNYYFLILILLLSAQPRMLFAETIWPKLSFEKESKNQIVHLESLPEFKLQTLRQESNPTKLILVFETETAWQAKELEVNETRIVRIDLKPLTPKESSLEIQLSSSEPLEFELNNTVGNFRVIFPIASKERILDDQNLAKNIPLLLPMPSPTITPTSEKQIAIQENISLEPSPTATISAEAKAIKNIPNPDIFTKNLTAIDFVNLNMEDYLLLSLAPKPNFSFTLTEQGHYEILIPEFKLSGNHLAQIFYAPQNSRGFLSVRAAEVRTEEGNQLLIKINVEPFFQLTFVPIPEGIKVVPTISATK